MEVNQRQKEFYNSKKKNLPTRIWSFFRNGILNKTRKSVGVERQIYELHKSWLGDLSDKKVLDLGCYEGNSLSYYLAANSKEYTAIDLSERGITVLRKRLSKIPHARAIAIDFFSKDFVEKNFDLIYAYGVLHHFKDTDALIDRLNEKLSPGGLVISNDPLQTSLPIRFIRKIYRPFQSDKDWEWPFTKTTYYKYEKAFNVLERRGMLGKAKWFFLVNLLPFPEKKLKRIGKKWHEQDWSNSLNSDNYLFQCMHFTMLMQKKQ